jgi:DNA-binding IclR family transcriptional regulator
VTDRYRNEAQQRLCKVVLLLAGHEFDGVAPSDLAKALKTNPSNVTRDLANLKEAGLAEALDTGRWRLGPKLVQVALQHADHVGRMTDRMAELKTRYSRIPT